MRTHVQVPSNHINELGAVFPMPAMPVLWETETEDHGSLLVSSPAPGSERDIASVENIESNKERHPKPAPACCIFIHMHKSTHGDGNEETLQWRSGDGCIEFPRCERTCMVVYTCDLSTYRETKAGESEVQSQETSSEQRGELGS